MHCASGRHPVDLVAVKSGNFEKMVRESQGILFAKIIGHHVCCLIEAEYPCNNNLVIEIVSRIH